MNHRIFEAVAHALVLAPVSVESATLTPVTTFVDMQSTETVDFILSTAALNKGKKVTLELWGADDANGSTNARKLTDVVHTVEGNGPVMALVSYKADPANPRYIGVKFQHDAGSPVLCSVVAEAAGQVMPAPDGSACTLIV